MTRNGLIATCFVCLLIGGVVRVHGQDPTRHITQYAPTTIPDGSYRGTCAEIKMRDGHLTARCRNMNGDWVKTELADPSRCAGHVGNSDGQLICEPSTAPLPSPPDTPSGSAQDSDRTTRQSVPSGPDDIPPGSYAFSCTNIKMSNGLLTARCRNMNGDWVKTELADPIRCAGHIGNSNGNLTCEASRIPSSARQGALSLPVRNWERTIAQYQHTAWGPKEGAPGVVTALAQSADGYLWLGSSDGVYRFDGITFERYQPQSGVPLPAAGVNSLLALPNGDLWIGFRSAISLLRKGRATNYTAGEGVPREGISKLAQDREGVIWAATDAGLVRLEGSAWKKVGEDWNFPGKSARTIFIDRQGTLWVSTEDTLVFLPPGEKRFQPTGIAVGQVTQIAQAADGKLWMAETTRSVRPIPLSDKRLPPDEAEVSVGSRAILFDRDGSLWITSMGDGLRRSQAPESLKDKTKEFSSAIESFTTKDGLTDDVVLAILQDREGNIWTGTSSGLDGFRKTNLVPVSLPFKTRFTVLAAGDAGETWVQEQQSMFRIYGGVAVGVGPFPDWGLFAHTDAGGTIWWICQNAIYRYEKGKYSKIALPPSFQKTFAETGIAATEDGTGALWLAAARKGLFYWKAGVWRRLETSSEYANLSPRAAFTDWMGRAWFGYDDGTIILVKDENIQKVFSPADSLVGRVRAINGRERHTWIGGDGLVFFDGNRFQRIGPTDAETFGLVLGVEETSDGSLWLAGSRAVIQIPASEVQRALNGPSYRVKYRSFDSFDGLPGTLNGISTNPKEIQGTDGRLWFGATGGVVFVDPADVSTNTLPPPVSIRSVRANGRQLDSLSNLALPPRTTALQIGYAGLSLSVPERVRYRYKLEEVDKGWQDAGARREAFYTRLGPGDYHFRVIACNEDGIWNTEGATLQFSVAPAWFQTIWFRTFCVVAFFLLLGGLYQMRLRQVRHEFNVSLEARVNERTRIARELHDTLLQSFNALLLRFQTAAELLSTRPDEARRTLDSTIDQTTQALIEGRDAVQQLRSTNLATSDLVCAIGSLGQSLADGLNSDAPAFHIEVEGTPRDLPPNTRDEVYRIACEAVRNAFRHAQARQVEVEIHYDRQQLRLRIRDDGKGIDPQLLCTDGLSGHYGLRGMRERAQSLGGELNIWSEVNSGTEIDLTVPSSSAYTKSGLSNFRIPARRRQTKS